MSLDPDLPPVLAAEAVEAHVLQDDDGVMKALGKLMLEGSSADALVFTTCCMFTIEASLYHGMNSVAGPVSISPNGTVTLIQDALVGHRLFAELLALFVAGNHGQVIDHWMAAEEDDQCGAVGTSVWAAGSLLKQRRAVLN